LLIPGNLGSLLLNESRSCIQLLADRFEGSTRLTIARVRCQVESLASDRRIHMVGTKISTIVPGSVPVKGARDSGVS